MPTNIKNVLIVLFILVASGIGGYIVVSQIAADKNGTGTSATDEAPVRVTIPEGLRKEQIASIFAAELGWTKEQEKKFVMEDTAIAWDVVEGHYPPGVYMVPPDATTFYVAEMMRGAAREIYTPFTSKLNADQWNQVLKVASIIQKEGQSIEQMETIAEQIWHRLDAGQPIRSDATIQYAKDTILNYGESGCEEDWCGSWKLKYDGVHAREHGWWNPIIDEDRYGIEWEIFNTYLYPGLPERPISNPNLVAIEAAVSTRYGSMMR